MLNKLKPTIGIIGVGFVGGEVKRYFEKKKYQIFVYDKYKMVGSVSEVNKADVIFIATPTPYKNKIGFDLSAVKESIKILKTPKIVVIKSTVLPGSTNELQKAYPKHMILFNPEFLTEANAEKDFNKPHRQIMGYTTKSKKIANWVLNLLPKSKYAKCTPASEAEMVKYMANIFLAMKVVYANQFYDICKALHIDYALVKEAVVQDPRIADSHFDVMHFGYRGYGGKCFPKDVNAFLQLAYKINSKPELIKNMRKINKKLLGLSNISEKHFL